ncbi:D-mandelate dehydrogenase-like dehydrogenase [Ascoidea rubescens DSM 1968]|uniref:Putative hydroxyisocaproate dehydrogenase n=1 Tax=Ascoidea rubescens DSM 1968 TaxID=1344418 RepID=A0A1D2VFW7_9ASCO|nr:putative hydroxyisocaproate dehydrogenase [Ascoidea rubescens DSM 1968]ODV60472.1 putative hydroxyisocaproate dehydrogenase [Ascoidea rubescens DSM 1968]
MFLHCDNVDRELDPALPIILQFPPFRFSTDSWNKLSNTSYIIQLDESFNKDKAKLISYFKTNKLFQRTQIIARTYLSTKFDREIISVFPKGLKIICHAGAGYDLIDTSSLIERKIQLSNVPILNNPSTADTHLYLLIGAMRNFYNGRVNLNKGLWKNQICAGAPIGHNPNNQTLGILGLGGIGKEILERVKPLNFKKVIYYNRSKLSQQEEKDLSFINQNKSLDLSYVSFNDLLSQSDVISLNIPLNDSTFHIINQENILKMKDNVVIINTSRGGIINESHLLKYLKSGKISSFGTDVFENEPLASQELIDLPQVIATPHMGTHTYEAIAGMEECVIQNIYHYLSTGKVQNIVPEQLNHPNFVQ